MAVSTLKRLTGSVLAGVLLFGASAAYAQVKLLNSIQKVETFVNEQGEVERRLIEAKSVVPGDELRYVIRFKNEGDQTVDAGTIVITDMIPEHTEYLKDTAYGSGTNISYSLDGNEFAEAGELVVADAELKRTAQAKEYSAIRWRFGPALEPGESSYVSFNVRLK